MKKIGREEKSGKGKGKEEETKIRKIYVVCFGEKEEKLN